MIIWHRRGCHGTTPRHRSRNIANSTFSEGWLQETLRICRFADRASHPPCKKHCKYNAFMQNAAKRRFWDHTMGREGGGVVANREPGSYIQWYMDIINMYIYNSICFSYCGKFARCYNSINKERWRLPASTFRLQTSRRPDEVSSSLARVSGHGFQQKNDKLCGEKTKVGSQVAFEWTFISRWWFQIIIFYNICFGGKISILPGIFQIGWLEPPITFTGQNFESLISCSLLGAKQVVKWDCNFWSVVGG